MADKATIESVRTKVHEYRKLILRLCQKSGGLHIGGDLSASEVLVSLFQYQLNIDPSNPTWDERDRFILSKGHCGASLYLTMAQRGYFDIEEIFATYKGHETKFGMHPSKTLTPALDSSSGSLGHGLSIAVGIALAGKIDKKKYRTYCLLGDGENDEGSVWEAAMAAAQFKLGNLIAVVDKNGMSLDGFTKDIINVDSLPDKWRAFNWNVIEIDGNNLEEVLDTYDKLPSYDTDVPTMIIAYTVKGKGVSYMENNPVYHHKGIDEQQLAQALAEVDAAYEAATRG